MKRIMIFLLFLNNCLFSQEVSQMEIEAKYFKLVETAYRDMESRNIDLSEYKIQMRIENEILYVRFYKPYSKSWRGSPPGYPILNYEINAASGEIIRIQGER